MPGALSSVGQPEGGADLNQPDRVPLYVFLIAVEVLPVFSIALGLVVVEEGQVLIQTHLGSLGVGRRHVGHCSASHVSVSTT